VGFRPEGLCSTRITVDQRLTEPLKSEDEVALVVGAVGLGLGQAPADVERLLVEARGLLAPAHRPHQVAELVVGDRQIALVVGTVGLGVGQLPGDVEILLVEDQNASGDTSEMIQELAMPELARIRES
jgi:hypothetical protein